MELRHIRYFIAVAEELHFAKAAVKLGIAQPPLSQQIKQLERELNVELFTRTSRQVKLTPAGEDFLVRARVLLGQSQQMIESARSIANGLEGTVNLGVNETTIDLFLPAIVKKLRNSRPGITLKVHEMQTSEQIEGLRRKTIDIGFMRLFKHDIADLRSTLLLREPYLIAMPESHPLAKKKNVSLACLKTEGLITFPRSMQPELYDELMRCFAILGVTPNIVQEATTKHTTLSLVRYGIGLALVPQSAGILAPKKIVLKPILKPNELPDVEHFIVSRNDENQSVFSLILEACKYKLRYKSSQIHVEVI